MTCWTLLPSLARTQYSCDQMAEALAIAHFEARGMSASQHQMKLKDLEVAAVQRAARQKPSMLL